MVDTAKKVTAKIAVSKVMAELKRRGWHPDEKPWNSPHGDIWAYSPNKKKCVKIEVKGNAKRGAFWLSEHQVNAVDVVIVMFLDSESVWVFSKEEALRLLNKYVQIYTGKHVHPPPPKSEGFNVSQLPDRTGWAPLDHLLP